MVFRFSSKATHNGWTYQLEYNDETQQYKYGTFIFASSDVGQMTKKQLDKLVSHLRANGYCQTPKDEKKNDDIYKYNGSAEISYDTENILEYCNKVQKLIYEHSELFEGFDNNTIYAIDVATFQFIRRMKSEN